MKQLKKIIFFIIVFFSILFYYNCLAQMSLSISPIKYEIQTKPGVTITKTAKIINNSDKDFKIKTGKANFTSKDQTGNPRFLNESEIIDPELYLANWIEIEEDNFMLKAREEKNINFTINIPENASPGGYYGTVFFRSENKDSNNSTGQIGVNINYGVLIILKIEGDIIINGHVNFNDIRIEIRNTFKDDLYYDPDYIGKGKSIKSSKKSNIKSNEENILYDLKDDCLIDLTNSDYDGKCIDNIINTKNKKEIQKNDTIINEENNNIDKENPYDDFSISFKIPFENEGNTHIKPKGKIKLIDESGKELRQIGKEIIKNDFGAVIGEKIVDYIPINDVGGNVLPNSIRQFESSWKGFPYKSYNEDGNEVLNYWSPGEYYTKKNIENRNFLWFWERVAKKQQKQKINALIDLSYEDKDGENINFNSAREFDIYYIEEYIQLNPYILILVGLLVLILIFFYLLRLSNTYICSNKKCKKRIRKKLKICPYCGNKQSK